MTHLAQKKYLTLLILLFLIGILSSCGFRTGNPTASEILKRNPNADIFKFNDLVYSNASDVEWLQERSYSLGKEVGEIKSQRKNRYFFLNEHATQLPAGTKIYTTSDGNKVHEDFYILIVELNEKEAPYMALIEG